MNTTPTVRYLMVMSLLDDAVTSGRHEEPSTGSSRMQVSVKGWRACAIREGECHKDVVRRVGWFDVAVEIEVDAFGHAIAATKILIHPDSELQDTSRNRKNFATVALKAWAMGKHEPVPVPAAQSVQRTKQQQAVWDNFANDSPRTFHRVEDLLSQGENVVVVLGNGVTSCHPYRKTNDAYAVAMALQEKLVRQTGVPLPIGDDGRPRFAFLAWKSADPIDAPSEIATVALANSPNDLPLLKYVQSLPSTTVHNTVTLDDVM